MKIRTRVYLIASVNTATDLLTIVNTDCYAFGIETNGKDKVVLTDLDNVHIVSLKKAEELFSYVGDNPVDKKTEEKVLMTVRNMISIDYKSDNEKTSIANKAKAQAEAMETMMKSYPRVAPKSGGQTF